MSEPLPGSVTVAPDGQTYIYFGGVWGKAEGVTGGIKVDYNTLDIKPETSFNDAVNKIKNTDNANVNNKWLRDQIKEYNVPTLQNQSQVDQFLNGEKVDGFPQFDDSTTETRKAQENARYAAKQADIRKNRLARYGKRRQGGILRYPAESLTEHTDYLQIDIERYAEIGTSYVNQAGDDARYVTGNRRTNAAGRSRRLSRKPLINAGTILLPIPAQLQDTNNVVYGESRLNGLAAAGVDFVGDAMSTLGRQIATGGVGSLDLTDQTQKFKTALEKGLGGSSEEAKNVAADLVTKKLASEAVNIFGANVTPNQLLARGNGEILNPNMELLFSDVTIRNFRFSFKLTPRNARESEQVRLIIRAFKRNMAPQAQGGVSDGSNFFLRTPNVFKLRYRSGSKDHPFLNKFKQCFLTDMQTTYTADGVYSTYDDGTPVSMQLDLSFKELQPIYDIDYDERPGIGAVGY